MTTTTQITDHHKELIDNHYQSKKEILCKALLATVLVVAGIALLLFTGADFFATGVGLILLGAMALYYYYHQYHHTTTIFNRAIDALSHVFF
jgi:hypothetical protein